MAVKSDRLYWDASVFLCFLSEAEEERRHICEDILHHAKDGKVEIITSMYCMVEVIRPKAIKHPTPLTDEQVALLEGMFKWPWVKKIQVHEELARDAARLARAHGLKPADAIHAATAIAEKVDQLQRWDYDFNKVGHLIPVTEPAYLSQMPLLQVKPTIGPTPTAFVGPSTVTQQPVSQSPGDGKVKESQPAPALPAAPQAAPAPPPPDSSPSAQKPPQTEK